MLAALVVTRISTGTKVLDTVVRTVNTVLLLHSEAGDDALLACCFCAKNYCHVEACLGSADAVLPAPLVAKPAFVWACPSCFKRAVDIEVQRGLRPAGQAVPGAKKRKRVPAGARGGRGGRGRGHGGK